MFQREFYQKKKKKNGRTAIGRMAEIGRNVFLEWFKIISGGGIRNVSARVLPKKKRQNGNWQNGRNRQKCVSRVVQDHQQGVSADCCHGSRCECQLQGN
jgi:hypothetical protein